MMKSALKPILGGAALLAVAGCPLLGGNSSTNNAADGGDANQPAAVVTGNRAPVASAGDDQSVTAGDLAVLDGSKSSDPDGDHLRFIWVQVAGTPTVELQNASSSRPQFVAPTVTADTVLTFQLFVTDGLLSSSDQVSVTVHPK